MILGIKYFGQPWDTIIGILAILFLIIVPINSWYYVLHGEIPIIEYIKEKLRYNFNNNTNNKSNNNTTKSNSKSSNN